MTTPTVSVYLPTRNRCTLVVEAARSVLDQTFRDFELIIADDASDDDTPQTLARLAESDSRIKVVRASTRLGPSAIRNLAIDAACGELITGLDDDDLMLPRRVDDLVRAAAHHESLICTGFYVERDGRRRMMNSTQRLITLNDLLHYNVVGNQALLRRRQFIALGGFDPDLPASEDYDLWTRAVDQFGPAIRVTPPTYIKRELRHFNQLTNSTAFAHGAQAFTEKYRHRMNESQLKSQRLINLVAQRAKITFKDLGTALTWPTARIFTRYMLSSVTHSFGRKK